MADSSAAASAAAYSIGGDARRQGGWLPGNQDDLEAWLTGHRERVAAKGEHVPLHPVLAEFQALIDSDPVVRLYLNERNSVTFQFGGSTHCLVFRPGAIGDFSLTAIPQPHRAHPPLVRVRSKLATAASW